MVDVRHAMPPSPGVTSDAAAETAAMLLFIVYEVVMR